MARETETLSSTQSSSTRRKTPANVAAMFPSAALKILLSGTTDTICQPGSSVL